MDPRVGSTPVGLPSVAAPGVDDEAREQRTREARQKLFKVIDVPLNKRLQEILKSMKRRPKAKHFCEPVRGVPNYELFIVRPMDLETVGKYLKEDLQRPYTSDDPDVPAKCYLTVEEFAYDVRQVFLNCFLYNLPGHHVFKDGRDVCRAFEEQLAELVCELEQRGPRVSPFVRLQLLIADLIRNPLAEWYRRPQEWQALGDIYLSALSSGTPMDLHTIRDRLARGHYARATDDEMIDAFAADVGLVWQNALDFNQNQSGHKPQNKKAGGKKQRDDMTNFGVMADMLKETFKHRLKSVRSAPRPVDLSREAVGKRQRLRDACERLPKDLAAHAVDYVDRECPEAVGYLTGTTTAQPAASSHGPWGLPGRKEVDQDKDKDVLARVVDIDRLPRQVEDGLCQLVGVE